MEMMRGDQGDGTTVGGEEVPVAAHTAPGWWRRLGRDSAHPLTSLPLAVTAVVLVAVLVSVGVGLAVLLIGLPLLALGLLTARGFAHLERLRLGRLWGEPSP